MKDDCTGVEDEYGGGEGEEDTDIWKRADQNLWLQNKEVSFSSIPSLLSYVCPFFLFFAPFSPFLSKKQRHASLHSVEEQQSSYLFECR